MADPDFYTVGGTVQAVSNLYIYRSADEDLLQLCYQRVFAYVLTPRQMGKSSLMVRTFIRLGTKSVRTAIIDLQELGTQVTAEQWYFGFLVKLEDQFELDTDVVSWWQERQHLGVSQRLTLFFREVLLHEIAEPLVIFVDEIDSTLSLDFTDDFFIAIRSLYMKRATDPEFERLSFVLLGVATPGDLIQDIKRTPFNIGQQVDLTDFTLLEAEPLGQGLGLPEEEAKRVLKWVLDWTGGHPYLTQYFCQKIAQEVVKAGRKSLTKREVEVVKSNFLKEQSEQDSNLVFVRDMLTKRIPEQITIANLLKTYRQVWRVTPYRQTLWKNLLIYLTRDELDEEQSLVKSHLKLSGIIKRDDKKLRVRNQIYYEVFNEAWIRENLLESWRQRLKPFIPAASILLASILVIGLILYADRQTKIANLRKQVAQALHLLETPRAVDGMILAIHAVAESRKPLMPKALESVDGSLLRAVQTVREQNLLRGHEDTVWSVAFSTDGQRVVSGSSDHTVRLWNINGDPIGKPFQGHEAAVLSVAFSPDGQRIISSSWDKTIRLWGLTGNSIGQPFQGHEDAVLSVAFSPDGQLIVSGSKDRTVRLWNLYGAPIGQPFRGHENTVLSVAFSPDGQRIVSGSSDGTIRMWDLNGNSIGQPFRGHKNAVLSVAFSPDGQRLVSGSKDSTVQLWDLNGNPIGQPFWHSSGVNSVAFSLDGQRIVSGSSDDTIRLWDLNGNPIGKPFRGHDFGVLSVAFSPDGQHLVSSSWDKTARLWNINNSPISRILQGDENAISSVVFSPDGQHIVTGSWNNSVQLWDLNGNLTGPQFQRPSSAVLSVAFSPDGRRIVSGGWDGSIRLWDLNGNLIDQFFQGDNSGIWSVAFSPDGQRIISGSNDNLIRLWDLNGNLIGEPFHGHQDVVWSVAFSPDGRTIVSGSRDKTVRLWDLTGNLIGQLFQGHTSGVSSVTFSPDGQRIVSGSEDSTLRLWDLKGNPIGQPFQGHQGWITSVAFSPDGQRIVSSSSDNTVRLWDLQGNPIGQPFQGHYNVVSSVTFSPDGQHIISGSWDKTMRLWQGNWQGWLKLACTQLREHSVLRHPEQSFDPEAATAARRVCEGYWLAP